MAHPFNSDEFRLTFPEPYRLLIMGISHYVNKGFWKIKISQPVRATYDQQQECLIAFAESSNVRAVDFLDALVTPRVDLKMFVPDLSLRPGGPYLPARWTVTASFLFANALGDKLQFEAVFIQPGVGDDDLEQTAAAQLVKVLGANDEYRALCEMVTRCASRFGQVWEPPNILQLIQDSRQSAHV